MRAFLVPLTFVLLVSSTPNPVLPQYRQPVPGGLPEIVQPGRQRGGDTVRMWKRAEIKVVPLDIAAADRAELQSLRERLAQAQADFARLPFDPAMQQQFSRDMALMQALLRYAERQGSNRGKSATALEVQNNLNHLQGQMMCQACHTRTVATSAAATDASIQ